MLSWLWRGKKEEHEQATRPETVAAQEPQAVTDDQAPVPAVSEAGETQRGSRLEMVTRPEATLDYLATPAVAAYFDAREHEAYYRSLKRVGPRRDFHGRLIATLERFVDSTDDPAAAADVDRVMAVAVDRRGGVGTETLLHQARTEARRGVDLLALAEPVSYESLKTAYRVAARRYHPDAGGDHEAMVAVNDAFALVHDLLREQQIGSGDAHVRDAGLRPAFSIAAESCADYRYVCGDLLFRATLDDWNVDTAAWWLERITSPEWQRSPYARDRHQRLTLTEPAGRLATRLAVVRNAAAAWRAVAVAEASLRVAEAEGLHYEQFVPDDVQAILAGTKWSPVVVSHPRQAENAFRLGVIDERRYSKAIEKHAAEAAAHGAKEEDLARLRDAGGFLRDLPTDGVAAGKVVRASLVPEPGYYVTRLADLTDDQQAEYLSAFGPAGSLLMVRKYLFVRLVSLLESVLLHPGTVDADAAASEAAALGPLHDGTGTAYASDATAAIHALAAQSMSERGERARLLGAIEGGAGRVSGGIQISLGGSLLGPPLSADYMKTILRPLSDLVVLLRQGSLPINATEQREQAAWNRDLEALRSPAVEASAAMAWAAADIAKDQPERAVAVWTQHCGVLLRLGESMVHVQELQLGYWVDRLTGALVRLKQWDEALAWLVRYFNLPSRYRDRSSASEEERLRKRLERCRGKVT